MKVNVQLPVSTILCEMPVVQLIVFDVPELPSSMTGIVGFVGPVEPVAPVAPVVPVGPPDGPVEPVAPVEDAVPAGPVNPVDPVVPVGPVAPVEDAIPAGPVVPVSPVGPAVPVGPVDPPPKPCARSGYVSEAWFLLPMRWPTSHLFSNDQCGVPVVHHVVSFSEFQRLHFGMSKIQSVVDRRVDR